MKADHPLDISALVIDDHHLATESFEGRRWPGTRCSNGVNHMLA
jgi:hypothetical protein